MGVATFSDALPGIRGSSIVDLGIACASPTVPRRLGYSPCLVRFESQGLAPLFSPRLLSAPPRAPLLPAQMTFTRTVTSLPGMTKTHFPSRCSCR